MKLKAALVATLSTVMLFAGLFGFLWLLDHMSGRQFALLVMGMFAGLFWFAIYDRVKR